MSEVADLKPTQLATGKTVKDYLITPPHDAKNPNTNQARHCYAKYNEFFRCERFKGEGAKDCAVFKFAYNSLCPDEWVEKWDEQREAGTFPGPL